HTHALGALVHTHTHTLSLSLSPPHTHRHTHTHRLVELLFPLSVSVSSSPDVLCHLSVLIFIISARHALVACERVTCFVTISPAQRSGSQETRGSTRVS